MRIIKSAKKYVSHLIDHVKNFKKNPEVIVVAEGGYLANRVLVGAVIVIEAQTNYYIVNNYFKSCTFCHIDSNGKMQEGVPKNLATGSLDKLVSDNRRGF